MHDMYRQKTQLKIFFDSSFLIVIYFRSYRFHVFVHLLLALTAFTILTILAFTILAVLTAATVI